MSHPEIQNLEKADINKRLKDDYSYGSDSVKLKRLGVEIENKDKSIDVVKNKIDSERGKILRNEFSGQPIPLKTREIQGKNKKDTYFYSENVKLGKIGVEIEKVNKHPFRSIEEIGKIREEEIKRVLQKRFPESDGYRILEQRTLRVNEKRSDGEWRTARVNNKYRIEDFVIVKDNKVVKCIEVTSENQNKTSQLRKGELIRNEMEVYVEGENRNELIPRPRDAETEVWRIE